MKTISKMFLMAVFILVTTYSIAQAEISQVEMEARFTNGFVNGRFWRAIDGPKKAIFIEGILGGSYVMWHQSKDNFKDYPLSHSLVNQLRIPDLTIEEIMEKLDQFYKDPNQRIIPVADAYFIISKEWLLPEYNPKDDIKELLNSIKNKE